MYVSDRVLSSTSAIDGAIRLGLQVSPDVSSCQACGSWLSIALNILRGHNSCSAGKGVLRVSLLVAWEVAMLPFIAPILLEVLVRILNLWLSRSSWCRRCTSCCRRRCGQSLRTKATVCGSSAAEGSNQECAHGSQKACLYCV